MTWTDRTRSTITLLRSRAVAAGAALAIMAAAGYTAVGASVVSGDPGSSVSTAMSPAGQRIVVRFDDVAVAGTLADTSAGRDFAALLPLTVELRDPMGQAKAGRLSVPLDPVGAVPVVDPEEGGIYYLPGSQTLAVFYDDLGQTVPPPGLIQLGAVDGDLSPIAAAGNRIRVRVDLADPAANPVAPTSRPTT